MATLIANADGNLTGASTFCAAETGTGALNLVRNTTSTFAAAASSTSATFTVTNAKVIDGALLWVRATAASPTGTFKVDLQKSGVSQASVTVNKADLPDSTASISCPVFFKFTGTATGDGAATWTLVVTTTGTGTVTYNINAAGATNWTRALRTTTAATPTTNDDLYIVGELTGAGTKNTRTVTMNSIAATVYGNGAVNSTTVSGGLIAVSNWATLSYGTTASTNYILRVAGDLIVYQNGTLTIGATAAEIPRTSTAVLEFQPVSADGDFGLRILDGTLNAAGLSRTSGKNIVQCKLTADVVSNSVLTGTFTASAGTPTANIALDASGNSLQASGFVDNASSTNHFAIASGSTVTNTTQVATVWLARGSGTNNRYVRVALSNGLTFTSGCYSDIDLQAGTAGTVTAVGTGTATSVSITAVGTGYLVKLTGKIASGAAGTNIQLFSCAVAGTPSYAGNTTQCFIFDHASVVSTSSLSDTTFNVDADTGWLSGDAIIVASTTQTRTECEIYPLNANAGASSMTSALYPFSGSVVSTHHGTSPIQAEVGLLTRNVKIRSTSTTLMAYVYCTALATVTVSWTEFAYLGVSSPTTSRGIVIDGGTTTNAKSITYCSLHDFDSYGLYCVTVGVTSLNLMFSNNVMWLSYNNSFVTISGAVTNADWTFDSNLVMRANGSAGYGFNLGDVGGVCINNIAVGGINNGAGFNLGEAAAIGTFDGNVVHSGGTGIETSVAVFGAINNCSAWRNTSTGTVYVSTGSSSSGLTFDNLLLFGNAATSGDFWLASGDAINISNSVIAGDTTFASSRAIGISPQNVVLLNLVNVDMSGVGGIFAPHTVVDFYHVNTSTNLQGTANNCKFGAPSLFSSRAWSPSSYYSFQKYNQTSGDHRTEMTFGQLRTDSSVYHTDSPSMRMTPNSAGNKLESAPKGKGIYLAVNSGDTVTAHVWVRKDATYAGAQPRLIVRANSAIGISTDTVLATYAAGTGSWNQISGTTVAATDDGAMEFIVDCDGTAGFINVDDWS